MLIAGVLKKALGFKAQILKLNTMLVKQQFKDLLVKEADFHGKAAYLKQREEEPCALLCTMTVDDLSVSGED